VTVLIGTSGRSGCFDEQVVRAMAANSPQPVILPLSNPTRMAEALPADIRRWSDGRALVATGSPFPPLEREGKSVRVGQCNNVFIFPGIGLGVLAAGAREVLPSFFTAAAAAVSAHVTAAERRQAILLPPVTDLREITRKVAQAAGLAAIKEGRAGLCVHSTFQHGNDPDRLATLIDQMRWQPKYLPLEAAEGS